MKRRVDERARVELGIRLLRSCYVILDDVRALNEKDKGRNAPDSPKHNQLRVELVAIAPSPQVPKKPDFSAAGPPRAPRKRKRDTVGQSPVTASGSRDTEESDS
jgi:hypothetical protein